MPAEPETSWVGAFNTLNVNPMTHVSFAVPGCVRTTAGPTGTNVTCPEADESTMLNVCPAHGPLCPVPVALRSNTPGSNWPAGHSLSGAAPKPVLQLGTSLICDSVTVPASSGGDETF